jgi:hypothetical protein
MVSFSPELKKVKCNNFQVNIYCFCTIAVLYTCSVIHLRGCWELGLYYSTMAGLQQG